MSKAITSHKGISLASGDRNLTYLYGISDFWSHIFENPQMVHDVLEANTYLMSEAYSKFLQLTSTLSLETIQATANSQVKLLLLDDSAKVAGTTSTYALPESIVSASYIMNRPFLPTETMEQDVHFDIDPEAGTIQFSKPLGEYLLPKRVNSKGVTQYALWMANAQVDEEFIYKHYGKLLNINSQTALGVYKSYVEGLYYLFANGPNIRYLERGLNLVMGVPVSRQTEKVTYIDRHSETNNWLVITDNNSYVIPFGLSPSVSEGDVVDEGTELASWVEVKDWKSEDNWWINISIPPEVIPNPPGGDSRAIAGSGVDYLMASYLKRHTFLVRLKTAGVSNFNIFQNIAEVVSQAKPSYTFPVYIWDVPLEDEILSLIDDDFSMSSTVGEADSPLSWAIEEFRRDTSKLYRGNPVFMRSNVPMKADSWITKFDDSPIGIDSGGDGSIVADPNLMSTGRSFEMYDYQNVEIVDAAAATVSHYQTNGGWYQLESHARPEEMPAGSWSASAEIDTFSLSPAFSGGSGHHLVRIDDTTMAVVLHNQDYFYTMSFAGGVWSQIGTAVALPDDDYRSAVMLDATRMLIVGGTNYSLNFYVYVWNGSTWTQESSRVIIASSGSALSIRSVDVLEPNRIVLCTSGSSTLSVYTYSATNWTIRGTRQDFDNFPTYLAGYRTIIALSSTRILAVSYDKTELHTLTWDDEVRQFNLDTTTAMPAFLARAEAVTITRLVPGTNKLMVHEVNGNEVTYLEWDGSNLVRIGDPVPVASNYFPNSPMYVSDGSFVFLNTSSNKLVLFSQADVSALAQVGFSTVSGKVKAGVSYNLSADIQVFTTGYGDAQVTASLNGVNLFDTSLVDEVAIAGRRALVQSTFTPSTDGELRLNIVVPGYNQEYTVGVYSLYVAADGDTSSSYNDGVVAMQEVYERGSYYEGWMSGLMTRANPSSTFSRGHVNYHNRESKVGTGVGVGSSLESAYVFGDVKASYPVTADGGLYIDHGRLVGLYSAREGELISKLAGLGHTVTELPYSFAMIPTSMVDSYYDLTLRDSSLINGLTKGDSFFDTTYLNFATPNEGYRVRVVGQSNVSREDFIVAFRSYDDVYSVYLYAHKYIDMPPYLAYDSSPEDLKITVNATERYRGGLTVDSPVYLVRGSLSDQYSDSLNPTSVTIDRNNVISGSIISEKEHV